MSAVACVCDCASCVLGIEPGSAAGAANAFSHRAISVTACFGFLFLFLLIELLQLALPYQNLHLYEGH